jgi:hypothetical protein
MEIQMNTTTTRFPWYEPAAKDAFVRKQIDDLITALVARDARFYSYCGQQIMYLNGQVIDLYRKSEVLTALKRLNLLPSAYARDTVELLHSVARPLYQPIPEGTLGTINRIKEPKLRMTRYMHTCVAQWVKQAIEYGQF